MAQLLFPFCVCVYENRRLWACRMRFSDVLQQQLCWTMQKISLFAVKLPQRMLKRTDYCGKSGTAQSDAPSESSARLVCKKKKKKMFCTLARAWCSKGEPLYLSCCYSQNRATRWKQSICATCVHNSSSRGSSDGCWLDRRASLVGVGVLTSWEGRLRCFHPCCQVVHRKLRQRVSGGYIVTRSEWTCLGIKLKEVNVKRRRAARGLWKEVSANNWSYQVSCLPHDQFERERHPVHCV